MMFTFSLITEGSKWSSLRGSKKLRISVGQVGLCSTGGINGEDGLTVSISY
jgi:hypothetical protein